jgi:predicted dehydrogenase
VALPAAKAGCHLLLEKPISHSLTGVKVLRDLVRQNDVQVLVGYQFRFHPVLQKIKAKLDDDALGEVLTVRAHWGEYLPDWHPWEDFKSSYVAQNNLGGGVVLTLSHPIDYLRWLFDDVNAVQGWTVRRSGWGLDVEDSADFYMRHVSGVVSNVHLDLMQRPRSHELMITGTQGILQWSNEKGFAIYAEAESGEQMKIKLPRSFSRNELFLSELRHFINVAKGLEEPICTLEDGIMALRLALTVKEQNLQTGFIPVIPLEPIEKSSKS